MRGPVTFRVVAEDPVTGARAGELHTPHGVIETPVFMPVGTQGTVKAMAPFELTEMGAHIILGNTYHLWLRPGSDLVASLGGLHRFMGWSRGLLTDSGGFQVFSLGDLRTVSEEGVAFRSHIDGGRCFLSPEDSMRIQEELGSDIAMCFDECVALPTTPERSRDALERTLRSAERCQRAHRREDQALFGIVQGAVFPEQRRECAERMGALDFPGYGIGGLSVGESHEEMYAMLEVTNAVLPRHKPRYLMGVGLPENLVEGVARGVDMFDCVLPTRNGRNGTVFTRRGRLNLKARKYLRDEGPIDATCDCYVCRHHSRAYVRHLYRAGEILAARLCSWHNLHFLLRLTRQLRGAILQGTFQTLRKEIGNLLNETDAVPCDV